jgi:hypothetical protein
MRLDRVSRNTGGLEPGLDLFYDWAVNAKSDPPLANATAIRISSRAVGCPVSPCSEVC